MCVCLAWGIKPCPHALCVCVRWVSYKAIPPLNNEELDQLVIRGLLNS